MPLRVLWVVKGLGPGGAERLLGAAARGHDPHRFEIECAYVLPWKDHLVAELEEAGVRVHCLSRRRRDPLWPVRLRQLIAGGGFDVVHVHSPLPGSVARLAVRTTPRRSRSAVVSTEHNRWETHRPPTRLLNRLTGRADAAALAVTEEVRASMRGRAARQAVTVRHGIDVAATAEARRARDRVRSELGLADDELVVGTVANFRPQKDYPNLLQALRLLVERDVPVRLVAVGQGPQAAEVEAMVDDLGLAGHVVLTGFRDDAVEVMGACDAFVLASRWEGLPVAVMEALALGLPIVATRVGGLAEELRPEVDALLVPPADPVALAAAIERVCSDADLRRRLAEASAARADEFDSGRAVAVIEDTYHQIAPRPRTDALPAGEGTPPPRRPSRPPAELDIRPAEAADRHQVLELLRLSLGGEADPRRDRLFAWKHDENPFGPSPMWVAIDDGRVVGFRTFMRWEFERGGRLLRAVRAVDTATAPDHQGRGLFTALTRHGLAEVGDEGVDLVFNTPNDQSRPGYLKMGWRPVGRLPAAVRFTGPAGAVLAVRSRVPADRWSLPLDVGRPVDAWLDDGGGEVALGLLAPPPDVRRIRTRVDERFLRWRFGGPLLGYRAVEDDDLVLIVRSRQRGEARELAVVACFGDPARGDRLAGATARAAGASYAIRLGPPHPPAGFLPLPGAGPLLTWRAVNDRGMPPLPNWDLTLGDIELF